MPPSGPGPGPVAHRLTLSPLPAEEQHAEQADPAAEQQPAIGKGGHPVLRVRVVVQRPPQPTAMATAPDAAAGTRAEIKSSSSSTRNAINLTAPAAPSSIPPRLLVRVAGHPVPADAAAAAAIVVAGGAGAAATASAVPAASPSSSPIARLAVLLLSALLYPLGVLFIASYVLLALLAASLLTWCVWPSLLLASHLYEALPFAKAAFSSPSGPLRKAAGRGGALLARLAFEAGHCTAVLGRLLTLPLRTELPSFYIAGLAKCGTTTLAAYLRRAGLVFPAGAWAASLPRDDDASESKLLSLAGLAEAAAKETHFLTGVLGRRRGGAPPSRALYRSFYPLLGGQAWWRWPFWRRIVARRLLPEAEIADAAPILVDATPTYAALPFVASRIRHLTPGARVAVVVRDPVDALASAEGMLRSLGALGGGGGGDGGGGDAAAAAAAAAGGGWHLSEPTGDEEEGQGRRQEEHHEDARFADLHSAAELWRELERLPVDAPIPEGIARRMCALACEADGDGDGDGGSCESRGLGGPCEAAKAGQRVAHLARVLGPQNVMVVPFADLVESPERVVRDVVAFAAGCGAGRSGGSRAPGRQQQQQQQKEGGGKASAAAAASAQPFRPLGARMAGGGGGASGKGGVGGGGGGGVHPTVRARLEREAFASSALLLGELTGIDPRVLLRRPNKGATGRA